MILLHLADGIRNSLRIAELQSSRIKRDCSDLSPNSTDKETEASNIFKIMMLVEELA